MISKRLRYEILRRDGNRCKYCGATAEDAKLTIDHVIPEALGGSSEPDNLVAACQDCNAGKTSVSPDQAIVDDVREDAMRMRKIMEALAYEAAQDRAWKDAIIAEFDGFWSGWHTVEESRPVPRPHDWENTISRFLDLGLLSSDLAAFIPMAMHKPLPLDDTWRYFCGIAWKALKERQDKAAEQLALAKAEAQRQPRNAERAREMLDRMGKEAP